MASVLRYCSENSLLSFSHSDANSFCTAQEKRVQMGVICNTYALIMLKATRAIMISSLGCAKVIEELFQLEAL